MNEKGFCDDVCIGPFLARLWENHDPVACEVTADADFCAIREDPIAAALEGRPFRGLSQDWIARVHSVYRDERVCWIQLFKDGDATASVLVRCSPFATPDHIRAVLSGWAPAPAFSLNVLKVMSAA